MKPRHSIFHLSLGHQIPHHSLHLPLPAFPFRRHLLIELVGEVAILVEVHAASPAVYEGSPSEAGDCLGGALYRQVF